MGVVIRRWVWLECIGVVSGCGYKEVYRYVLHVDFLIGIESLILTFWY